VDEASRVMPMSSMSPMTPAPPTAPVTSARTAGLVLLAAALGSIAGAQWERRSAPPASGTQPPRVTAGIVPAGLGPVVALGPVAPSSVPIRRDSRNLFGYAEDPAIRAKRLAGIKEAARLAEIEETRRRQIIAEEKNRREAWDAAERARKLLNPDPPPVTLALIGKMGSPLSPIAILATRDGDVIAARAGETVDGSFKLVGLDFETATIGYADRLVAAHPTWRDINTVLRMGAR